MLQRIKSKVSQREALTQLLGTLKPRFAKHEDYGTVVILRNYIGASGFSDFNLRLWMHWDWVGLQLEGASSTGGEKNLLGFATYSPKSKGSLTAAAFATDKQGTALYHDSRVFTRDGRDRPWLPSPMTNISGHRYHKIAYINDPSFLERVVEYHNSRFNSYLGKTSDQKTRKGFDPGTSHGGTRSEATFTARQSPIAHELLRKLKALGYKIRDCKIAAPDILVEKGKTSVLFEVKPWATTHDLILACGQVLIYNEHASASRLVVVSEKRKATRFSEGIDRFMKRHEIYFLPYEKEGNRYLFKNLRDILP